ncbi:MAG: hypothetical protein NT084_09875 [Bacteroidetes bacterium]|nr:hypothetical protein [Bacteroidota bacterium]
MKHFTNHIAVWMDHHQAHLIYLKTKDEYSIESLESTYDARPRIDGEEATGVIIGKYRATNNEYKKHNIENNHLQEFYDALRKTLQKYDEILLFGPTTAKVEFFNILFDDKSFSGKRISMESADKMTAPQMIAFAKSFYSEEVKK